MSYNNNQFSKPRGIKGRVAGWFMAVGSGNKKRIQWAISQMQPQPSDTVLEIGFGPGISIRTMSKKLASGYIYGIDESMAMIESAGRRNKQAVNSGKVKLLCSSANNLPDFEKKISKVLTINSFEFWEDKVKALNDLKKHMDTGGQIYIVHQVLHKKGESGVEELSETYHEIIEKAGFKKVATHKDSNLNILCVTGTV